MMSRKQKNERNMNEQNRNMQQQLEKLEKELEIQRQIAYAAGIFQTDVTVRTLMESLAEGVIVVDITGTVVLINRRAVEIFGYAPAEVSGRSINVFLPERSFVNHSGHVTDFFTNPHIRSMGQGIDLIGKRKDGTEFPVEVALSYLNTENGLLGMAFVTDITNRKQAEWALKLRNEELDAFAHTVAHDLKGSLTALIGYSEAIVDMFDVLDPDEIKDLLLRLASNGRRMNNVIDELLVFASVRKEDVVQIPLDMGEIVSDTLQRLNHVIREYQASVYVPDTWVNAMGYPAWVAEIWFNYISNALKYGDHPGDVYLGYDADGDKMRYWVKDSGPGVDLSLLDEIFKPFNQVARPEMKGYGLGLSIVKHIVEKLDGEVFVESEPGQGSTFGFVLPAILNKPG